MRFALFTTLRSCASALRRGVFHKAKVHPVAAPAEVLEKELAFISNRLADGAAAVAAADALAAAGAAAAAAAAATAAAEAADVAAAADAEPAEACAAAAAAATAAAEAATSAPTLTKMSSVERLRNRIEEPGCRVAWHGGPGHGSSGQKWSKSSGGWRPERDLTTAGLRVH